ncbi:class I SAM-dependent DNA methyltransferase [Sabulicella rubraurantiaca]|uniref:class I SAM-dependent DNA methyltransferase n=1 Tax=Sabulicella rubraurantiaca TaxID=2811429 RepID=UPI001A977C0C|nr:class I SAM-dependent methyltransferase [Sabulicella rubraurantiaca]
MDSEPFAPDGRLLRFLQSVAEGGAGDAVDGVGAAEAGLVRPGPDGAPVLTEAGRASLAAAAIPAIYRRHAAVFDRLRVRTLFERAWLEQFLALVPPGGAVLDLGCGMGEPMARFLAEAGRRVTGVDASPALLALARERMPAGEWIAADMRDLDLRLRFEGILAWDSFFHLSRADQRAMFPVFARHAAPGAALMFTSGPAAGEAIGSFEGEALFHASLDPTDYRERMGKEGFEVVAHRAEDAECGGRTVWLARRSDQAASAG